MNDFDKCGYCMLCPGDFDVTSVPDAKGIPSGKVCPTDALKRRVVGRVDEEDPNNNYYEYVVDESLCDGCGKCVKRCLDARWQICGEQRLPDSARPSGVPA